MLIEQIGAGHWNVRNPNAPTDPITHTQQVIAEVVPIVPIEISRIPVIQMQWGNAVEEVISTQLSLASPEGYNFYQEQAPRAEDQTIVASFLRSFDHQLINLDSYEFGTRRSFVRRSDSPIERATLSFLIDQTKDMDYLNRSYRRESELLDDPRYKSLFRFEKTPFGISEVFSISDFSRLFPDDYNSPALPELTQEETVIVDREVNAASLMVMGSTPADTRDVFNMLKAQLPKDLAEKAEAGVWELFELIDEDVRNKIVGEYLENIKGVRENYHLPEWRVKVGQKVPMIDPYS